MNGAGLDPDYRRLKDRLIAATGLAFYADRDDLLIDLIGERVSALGLRDCSGYSQFLTGGEKGKAEMDVLIARLTIGETCFFRDAEVFAAIRDIILPDILERKQASMQLRIWSAGCSTGAEPYSLAIMLADELAERIAGWQVEICATDLNPSCLAQAAKGAFRARVLRTTSERVKRECFSKEGLIWTIHPRYRQWISFRQMNLAGGEFSSPLPAGAGFDLILCRNVMIYFAPEENRRLIKHFHQSLGDGGWLVVGAAEHSLENYRDFRSVRVTGEKLYQKVGLRRGLVEAVPKAAPEIPPQRVPRPPDEPGPPDVEGLRRLLDRGDWEVAAEYGRRLLTRNRLNPEIHFYQALIFENLGVAGQAEQSLRHAIYLDRNFALAHYHLGLALKRDGQTRAAARSFGNVLRVLAGGTDDAVVTAGPGVTATGMRELAKMHLEKSSGA